MIRLSQITSYLTCPRLCYYRTHFGEHSFTESMAAREIYLSLRQGFDEEWARRRCETLYENYNNEIFDSALKKFVYADHGFKTVEVDAVAKNEKLGIVVSIDEVLKVDSDKLPLFVALNPPERGVWFKDMVKAGAAGIVAGFRRCFIYYAYAGELRDVEITHSVKRRVLKLVERVKLIRKGFLPERRESGYCNYCSFREECESKPETFASKFL